LGLPIAGCEGEFDQYQEFHIFTGSKAKWWQITDDLPQYEQMPDDRAMPTASYAIAHCLNE
jgi:hypothetical protein